jgi:hypothetical protein
LHGRNDSNTMRLLDVGRKAERKECVCERDVTMA